jgi:hypothetical protein
MPEPAPRKMGFYKPGVGGEEYTGDTDRPGKSGEFRGAWRKRDLPPGVGVYPVRAQIPDQQYDGFVRATLRGMSAG